MKSNRLGVGIRRFIALFVYNSQLMRVLTSMVRLRVGPASTLAAISSSGRTGGTTAAIIGLKYMVWLTCQIAGMYPSSMFCRAFVWLSGLALKVRCAYGRVNEP